MSKIDCLVSCIIPLTVLKPDFEEKLKIVRDFLSEKFEDYEILIISHCYNSETSGKLDSILKKIDSIRFLGVLAKDDFQSYCGIGFENAIGDFSVSIDIYSDPVDFIEESVKKSLRGSDIVCGVTKYRDSIFYKTLRNLATPVLKIAEYRLPKNSTGSFCISRRALNGILEISSSSQDFFNRIGNSSYSIASLNYEKTHPTKRGGYFELFLRIWRILTWNSTRPMRFMSLVGFLGSVLAFFFSIYSLITKYVYTNVVEGWTSLFMLISILFCILFMILSVFGEYLALIADQSKEKRKYNIIFEKNSSVMIFEDRVNVLRNSESSTVNNVQTGKNH